MYPIYVATLQIRACFDLLGAIFSVSSSKRAAAMTFFEKMSFFRKKSLDYPEKFGIIPAVLLNFD